MLSNFICKPADIQTKLQQLQRKPGSPDIYIDGETEELWILTNYTSAMLGNISVLKEISPCLVTELVNAMLTASSLYDVCGAACELRAREQAGKADFREILIHKLEPIDTSSLTDPEKARIKIIISDTELYNPANHQRDITGKHHKDIMNDAILYRTIADKARAILATIG